MPVAWVGCQHAPESPLFESAESAESASKSNPLKVDQTASNKPVDNELVSDKPADPPVEKTPEPKQTPPTSPANKTTVDLAAFFDSAFNGELAAVEQAIKAGVDVNAADEKQQNALMLASFNGHTPVVKILLDNGATLGARDSNGRTPLMFAATGANASTVEFLIEKGAQVDAVDTAEKFTPLMYAAAEGQVEVVEVLLKHQADPGLRDVDGDTARDFASQNGHSAVVQLLTK